MRVELLVTPGCPHAQATKALVEESIADLGLSVELDKRVVASRSQAQEFDFHGSPTVRIDGADLEISGQGSEPGLACRLYPGGSGVPPRWLVEAGLVRALKPHHLLFLCVANSARSQMAQGLARAMAPPGVKISSAGSRPTSVRPEAVEVLREVGLDISGHRAKGLEALDLDSVEAVITLCAQEVCPTFPRPVTRVHWPLPDPAAVQGDRETRLATYREVRDELRRRLAALFSV